MFTQEDEVEACTKVLLNGRHLVSEEKQTRHE